MKTAQNRGDYIRRKREENGYTQEQLAEIVGVSIKTISSWENGKVENIKRPYLERLAELFGVTSLEVKEGNDIPDLDFKTKELLGIIDERALLALEIGVVAFTTAIVAIALVLWAIIPQDPWSTVVLLVFTAFGIVFGIVGKRVIRNKTRVTQYHTYNSKQDNG